MKVYNTNDSIDTLHQVSTFVRVSIYKLAFVSQRKYDIALDLITHLIPPPVQTPYVCPQVSALFQYY